MDNKTKEISKESKNSKKKDIFSILRLFFIKYPNAFNKKEPQPLKLGILEDIAEDLQGELTKSQIRRGLKYYTNSIQYHQAIMVEKHRVNLNGEKVDLITEKHKEFAQKQLEELLLKKRTLKHS